MKYIARTTLALTAALAATVGAQQPITIQHIRPVDQRGVNMFEPSKEDTVTFQGTRMVFAGAFLQDFQGLGHTNTALAKNVTTNGVVPNQNQLIGIGHGFNNASAILTVDV